MTVDQHLLLRDVAARLGIKKRTVWKWVRMGKLPTVRLSGPKGPHSVAESDLQAFIESRRNQPPESR